MEFKDLTVKILEYLDGELPTEEEKELFTALASDDELRKIMREHLAISRAVQTDLKTTQPPAVATFKILNSLGISIPTNAPTFDGISTSNKYWAKTRKFGIPIFVAIFSSILTFFITYYIFRSNESGNLSGSKAIVQTPPMIIPTDGNVANKPSNPYISSYHQKEGTKILKNEQPMVETNLDSQPSLLNPTVSFRPLNLNSYFAKKTKYVETNQVPKFFLQQEPFNIVMTNTTNKTIYFTLRGMSGKSFPNPNVSGQESNNLLSNSSIGFYFTQTDNIKFGIEFGNEIFGLNYLNVKDGIEYTYEQKPKLYWGAVGAEYIFPNQILNIPKLHPFVTLLAGGSQIGGPLIKGIAGFKYRPIGSNLEIYLAGEGTLLFYQNQRNYYLTRKIGLTYGMSIIF